MSITAVYVFVCYFTFSLFLMIVHLISLACFTLKQWNIYSIFFFLIYAFHIHVRTSSFLFLLRILQFSIYVFHYFALIQNRKNKCEMFFSSCIAAKSLKLMAKYASISCYTYVIYTFLFVFSFKIVFYSYNKYLNYLN